jgi:hypothetical protein
MHEPNCSICRGTGWVCENHSTTAWHEGLADCGCGGAGVKCEFNQDPEMPPGTLIVTGLSDQTDSTKH